VNIRNEMDVCDSNDRKKDPEKEGTQYIGKMGVADNVLM
jgi:hypothetical protein